MIYSTINGHYGEYPRQGNDLSGVPDNVSYLMDRVERQSLFVLSHLELQNQNRDLIFSKTGVERLNACLSEFARVKQHERLFVWEAEVSVK